MLQVIVFYDFYVFTIFISVKRPRRNSQLFIFAFLLLSFFLNIIRVFFVGCQVTQQISSQADHLRTNTESVVIILNSQSKNSNRSFSLFVKETE